MFYIKLYPEIKLQDSKERGRSTCTQIVFCISEDLVSEVEDLTKFQSSINSKVETIKTVTFFFTKRPVYYLSKN